MSARFHIGSRLTVSDAFIDALMGEDPATSRWLAADLMLAHQRGDWGDVDSMRVTLNRLALQMGGPLISVFTLPATKARVLIVTNREADYTSVMREYEWIECEP
jgi:hypothetical protein